MVDLLQVPVRKSLQRELQLICVIKSLNDALPVSGSRPDELKHAAASSLCISGHSQCVPESLVLDTSNQELTTPVAVIFKKTNIRIRRKRSHVSLMMVS